MARLGVAASNAAIQAVLPTPGTNFASLNSADTGTTGANELTTITRASYPAGAASAGTVSNTAAVSISNGGTQLASHVSIWSAVTAGTFVIGAPLASSVQAATVTFAIGALPFTAS